MPVLKYFDLAQLAAQPWKNGGGLTREVISEAAPGAADFDWRVSIATIEADGSFSRFDGVDRTIVLLQGAGVVLSAPGFRHVLQPLVPFSFAGETPVHCALSEGPTLDFNVMVRRGRAAARVELLRASALSRACTRGALFAVQGDWQVVFLSGTAMASAPAARVLRAGQGGWWTQMPGRWRLVPDSDDAALLAVAIESPQPATAARRAVDSRSVSP